jgi:hypothetical protein
MTTGSRIVGAFVLAAALAGCHSSSSSPTGTGGAGGGDPTTPDGFCQSLSAIVFNGYVTCLGGTPADAAKVLASDPNLCASFDASIAAHRSSFDPTNARACLDAFAKGFTCAGFSSSSIPTTLDCTVSAPLVPVGGTCRGFSSSFFPQECMGGGYCKRGPNHACDGTCVLPAAVNEPCDPLNDVRCAQGLNCDSTSKTCVMAPPFGAMGATCDATSSCAKGLYCDKGADAGAQGTCQPQKTSGPCASSSECAQGTQCAGPAGAKTCVAPKRAGDGCTPGQGECSFFTFCGADHKCSDTFAAVGQPCGSQPGSDPVPCVTGAYCDGVLVQGGTCRAKKQPGDACTGTGLLECDGNGAFCDTTTQKCVDCPF